MATIGFSVGATSLLSGGTAGSLAGGPLGAIGGLAAVGIAASIGGIIDSKFIFPALFPARSKSLPENLLGLGPTTADPGDPVILAYGQHVRVPTHLMGAWSRVQTSGGSPKTGVPRSQVVYSDILLGMNGRSTNGLRALFAAGDLVWYISTNFFWFTDNRYTLTASGANLIVTATTSLATDFTLYFKLNDVIKLTYCTPAGNNSYWKITSITAATTSAPATMTIAPRDGQTAANGTAGSTAAPGQFERVDDSIVESDYTVTSVDDGSGNQIALRIQRTSQTAQDFVKTFKSGVYVNVSGYTPSALNGQYIMFVIETASATDETLVLNRVASVPTVAGPYAAGTTTSPGKITPVLPSNKSAVLFAGGAPDPVFVLGFDETTSPLQQVEAHEGVGQVPSFHGMANAFLKDFNRTAYGNVPPQMEAILTPDFGMTVSAFLAEIWTKLAKRPTTTIDVSGMTDRPLHGYYVHGPQPVYQLLQPVMIAGQTVTQERGSVLAFFDIENADQVSIQQVVSNGNTVKSDDLASHLDDLAAHSEGASTSRPINVQNVERTTLPTAISVQFQDPALRFGKGSVRWGLRGPGGLGFENEQSLSLTTLVLNRAEATNLAATAVRRAWINGQQVAINLPPSYSHVLENDILAFSADGRTWSIRVTQVDRGADFQLSIQGVVEDVSLRVSAIPVNTGSGTAPPIVVVPPAIDAQVLDCSPIYADAYNPLIYISASAVPATGWAGATIYESVDNLNFVERDFLQFQGIQGKATNILAAGSTLTFDVTNSVNVKLYGGQILTSTTVQQVLQGANWAMLGNEMIAYVTATLQTDGSYTLTNLIRGLRDTADMVGTHTATDRFVDLTLMLLDGVPVPMQGVQNGATKYYKIVPVGSTIAATSSVALTWLGGTVRPFSPCRPRKVLDGSNNATIYWTPRRRQFTVDTFTMQPGTEETYESYDVDVYASSAYSTVIRRLTVRGIFGVSPERFLTYTADLQHTTDGLTLGATLYLKIYQTGGGGMRSHPLTISL
jgi:hypothetical protein